MTAGRGPLMMGAAPIGLFARTRPTSASPDCQYQFLAGSLDAPGKPMHPFPACSLVCIPCRPESRGWLRIKSPDPTVFPAMQPNYLGTQNDKDTMVAGLRLARSIFQTPTMQRITTGALAQHGQDSDADWLNTPKHRQHHLPPDQHLHDGARRYPSSTTSGCTGSTGCASSTPR